MRAPREKPRNWPAVAAAAGASLLAWMVGIAALGSAAAAGATPTLVDDRRISPRLHELTLRTPAVRGATRVRVLLPRGYSKTKRRYPVLLLLHGAYGDHTSWTELGDAERLTAGVPLIVVMPDSGATGGYVNWFNAGRGGPPRWRATTWAS